MDIDELTPTVSTHDLMLAFMTEYPEAVSNVARTMNLDEAAAKRIMIAPFYTKIEKAAKEKNKTINWTGVREKFASLWATPEVQRVVTAVYSAEKRPN